MEQPVWQHMLAVECDLALGAVADEAMVALADMRDKAIGAAVKQAPLVVMNGTVGGNRHGICVVDRHVCSHAIDYLDLAMAPRIDGALPELVAFIKPDTWAWQKALRIVVGAEGAFAVENVDLTLKTGGWGAYARDGCGRPARGAYRDLSKVTTLHRL